MNGAIFFCSVNRSLVCPGLVYVSLLQVLKNPLSLHVNMHCFGARDDANFSQLDSISSSAAAASGREEVCAWTVHNLYLQVRDGLWFS